MNALLLAALGQIDLFDGRGLSTAGVICRGKKDCPNMIAVTKVSENKPYRATTDSKDYIILISK